MIELTIMSAEAKRAETNLRVAQKEIQRKLHEAQRPQRVEELVQKVFNFAKSKVENSDHSCCQVVITDDEMFLWKPWNDSELLEAIDIVITLLKGAGYEVNNFHEYSKGWKTRSGKFGYFFIFW